MKCFISAALSSQITIDTGNRLCIGAAKQVSDHKANSVIESILARSKPVYAFDDIFAAKSCVRASDPLAFDDRMRIMLAVLKENLKPYQWNIGPAVRNKRFP